MNSNTIPNVIPSGMLYLSSNKFAIKIPIPANVSMIPNFKAP